MAEQQKTSIEWLKKTENTNPLGSILTIDNPESKAKIEDIYRWLDAQKQEIFIAKLRENQGKLEMFQDAPDDIGNLLQEIIQELNIQTKEETVKTTEETVKIEKRKKEQETVEVLKKTREQLEKTYALFWGQDKFEQIPGHKNWKEQATRQVQEEAAKKGEELSGEELATRVETSIILTNSEAIKSSLSPDKQKEFANLTGQLRASADFLKIPYETTPSREPISRLSEHKITTELLDFKSGDKVIRTGSEYRFGDQVIDISKVPPERSIERNGIRIPLSDKDGIKAENYQEQENYRKQKWLLTKEIGELEVDIEKNRENMKEKYLKLPEMKRDYESAIQEGALPEAEGLKNLIEKTEKELEEFKQKTEKLAILKEALLVLEKEEQERSARYQESLQSETEDSRSNLTFLASTHLDGILRDEGIHILIQELGRDASNQIMEFSLEKKWEEPDKKFFATGIKKLLAIQPGEESQFFKEDGYTMREFSPDGQPIEIALKHRLEANGVYGGIPPALIREKVGEVMKRK